MKSGKGSKLLGSLVKILQHNKEWMKSMHKLSGLFSIIPRIFVLSLMIMHKQVCSHVSYDNWIVKIVHETWVREEHEEAPLLHNSFSM